MKKPIVLHFANGNSNENCPIEADSFAKHCGFTFVYQFAHKCLFAKMWNKRSTAITKYSPYICVDRHLYCTNK